MTDEQEARRIRGSIDGCGVQDSRTHYHFNAHVLAERMGRLERQLAKLLGISGPLFGHLTWVRLQKNGKSRNIYNAGWSSLVARRAHNAPNANRLCRIQTT